MKRPDVLALQVGDLVRVRETPAHGYPVQEAAQVAVVVDLGVRARKDRRCGWYTDPDGRPLFTLDSGVADGTAVVVRPVKHLSGFAPDETWEHLDPDEAPCQGLLARQIESLWDDEVEAAFLAWRRKIRAQRENDEATRPDRLRSTEAALRSLVGDAIADRLQVSEQGSVRFDGGQLDVFELLIMAEAAADRAQ